MSSSTSCAPLFVRATTSSMRWHYRPLSSERCCHLSFRGSGLKLSCSPVSTSIGALKATRALLETTATCLSLSAMPAPARSPSRKRPRCSASTTSSRQSSRQTPSCSFSVDPPDQWHCEKYAMAAHPDISKEHGPPPRRQRRAVRASFVLLRSLLLHADARCTGRMQVLNSSQLSGLLRK